MTRALLLLLAFAAPAAFAQVPKVFDRQQGGIYIEPPAAVDPAYLPAGPNEAQPQALRLSVELSLDVPLRARRSAASGSGTQGSTAHSPTLQAGLRWQPLGDPWFVRVVFFHYLRSGQQQTWDPDFSYAFGYEDFRPETWSFFYANYSGTRFQPGPAETRFNFPEGQWSLERRFALPAALEPVLLVGDGDASLCDAGGHYMARYMDLASNSRKDGKVSLSLGCRYTRPEGWYGELVLYAWPDRGQQPWDPDFTYGFGWEGDLARAPGRVAIRYNNYSGNRFPGRARGEGEGRFTSGSVSLNWSAGW